MRSGAGLIAGLALFLCAIASARAETSDTLILHGGAVYTLDAARPWASAVVIRKGRIAYVGDDAGARRFAGRGARMIALDGRMVLPGFHDSHVHPMTGGMRLIRCRLGEFKTAEAVYAAVRACASVDPKKPWLIGSGWSPAVFGPGGPARAKLDELVPDRPAYLTTEDGYTAWVNSRALRIAGIAADGVTAAIEGELSGRVWGQIPKPTQREYREALRRSTAMANSFGVTSMFDASASPAVVDAYHAADQAGELTVRIVAAQRVDAQGKYAELIARRDATRGRSFRADAVKIFLDGEIDRRTAAMMEPYSGQDGRAGYLEVDPIALLFLVPHLDADGFMVHMHAMGDRAVHLGLLAVEQALGMNGAGDRRHQLAHVGVALPEDIRRFGTLGVAANFQPAFFHAEDGAAEGAAAALGPERATHLYPIGSIAAAGGRILASSDWPAPSMNPLELIQFALTRQPLDGGKPAQQPGERVDLATMLAAFTINGAWGAREETINGSIEVGKAADLVVLDRNLFETPVAEIHKVRVLLTLLDGDPVYGAEFLRTRSASLRVGIGVARK